MKIVLNLWVSYNAGNFMTGLTLSLSKRTVPDEINYSGNIHFDLISCSPPCLGTFYNFKGSVEAFNC